MLSTVKNSISLNSTLHRWNHQLDEYTNVKFIETSIEHLHIESKCHHIASKEAAEQEERFGPTTLVDGGYNALCTVSTPILSTDAIEAAIANNGTTDAKAKEGSKRKNQFSNTERYTQTKISGVCNVFCQTDPPPM